MKRWLWLLSYVLLSEILLLWLLKSCQYYFYYFPKQMKDAQFISCRKYCVYYRKYEVGKSRIATSKNSHRFAIKQNNTDVSYLIFLFLFFFLPCLLPSSFFYHEGGITRTVLVSRTVYLTWIWPIKEKMKDTFFVGKRSFTNASQAAFYSGNLIHIEAYFSD